MATGNPANQRERRARLKALGYKQILLTLDPESVAAVERIYKLGGHSGMTAIIKAALLTQARVLELSNLPRMENHRD